MNIPKLSFTICPPEDTAILFGLFLKPASGAPNWSNHILNRYPALKEIIDNHQEDQDLQVKVSQFIAQYHQNNLPLITSAKNHFQESWNIINQQTMTALSNLTQHQWPSHYHTITARVSINPICPRFLEQKVFDVFYLQDKETMQATAIHELLHFIYFEKWKTIFPNTKAEEMDEPHLVWHLSEIVPGIILNTKPIQDFFQYNFQSYDQYYEILIEGQSIIQKVTAIYNQEKSFSDFIKKSWQFIKNHEKEIINAFS